MMSCEAMRRCEFCEDEVEDYPQHLRSHHKMAGTGEASQVLVKCMFCLEQMSETDMFAHVFYGHNISGMFFSSSGGGEGGEIDLTSSNTVSVQTEDDPNTSCERFEPIPRVSADLDIIEQSENSSNNDEEQIAASEEHALEEERKEETEELTNTGCDLIYLDDDESDFEIEDDGPTSQPEIIFEPENSQPEDGADSEVTLIEIKNSNIPSKTQPSSEAIVDTPEPRVTLINIAKRKDPVASPSPAKAVRFSDVTNYYPIKKRGKLKRGARKLVPLILGANTSLKYLKYWGTTNKPD